MQRDFARTAPNRLWVVDLTQHTKGEGWLCRAVVVDAFSCRVVGRGMGERPGAELVLDATNMAIPRDVRVRDSSITPITLSQYTALAMGGRLRASGIVGSMGGVGHAVVNAAARASTLQTELLVRRRWHTRQELQTAIFDYIEAVYNRRRRHSALGYLSPEAYEQ